MIWEREHQEIEAYLREEEGCHKATLNAQQCVICIYS